jgi:biopolymer transport protein ExbB/TolQ
MDPAAISARPIDDDGRLRRKWKRLLILGIALSLGPVFGVLGLALGLGLSFHRIETTKAPTPGDLSTGVWIGTTSAAIGMLAGIAGACLALWSYRKLRALEPKTELLELETGPWT